MDANGQCFRENQGVLFWCVGRDFLSFEGAFVHEITTLRDVDCMLWPVKGIGVF